MDGDFSSSGGALSGMVSDSFTTAGTSDTAQANSFQQQIAAQQQAQAQNKKSSNPLSGFGKPTGSAYQAVFAPHINPMQLPASPSTSHAPAIQQAPAMQQLPQMQAPPQVQPTVQAPSALQIPSVSDLRAKTRIFEGKERLNRILNAVYDSISKRGQ